MQKVATPEAPKGTPEVPETVKERSSTPASAEITNVTDEDTVNKVTSPTTAAIGDLESPAPLSIESPVPLDSAVFAKQPSELDATALTPVLTPQHTTPEKQEHDQSPERCFLEEILLEVSWLEKRRPLAKTPSFQPLFPTALQFYGCWEESEQEKLRLSQSQRKLKNCLLKSLPKDSDETGLFDRRRPAYAALVEPTPLFGDIAEVEALNPSTRVEVEGEQTHLTWLSTPQLTHSLPLTIMTSAANTRAAKEMLGYSRPLSPVLQPQNQFHVKRSKRKCCPLHRDPSKSSPSTTDISSSPISTSEKACAMVWNMEEPLSLPPLCSCPNETLIARYTKLISAVGKEDLSALQIQAEGLMEGAGVCSNCAGILYFPFSFVEILLSQDVPTLAEVADVYPLPANTDIYCDGPRVTACIIAKNPKHEYDICRGLAALDALQHAKIYDVCSYHFYPGAQLSEYYWTSPGFLTADEMLPIIVSAESTPLRPPAQTLLNLLRRSPPVGSQSGNLYASRLVRRPFCVYSRKDWDASALKEDGLNALLQSHSQRTSTTDLKELKDQIDKLRKESAVLGTSLQALRDQVLAASYTRAKVQVQTPVNVVELHEHLRPRLPPQKSSPKVQSGH